MSRIARFAIVCSLVCGLITCRTLPAQIFTPLSDNGSFENALSGWADVGTAVTADFPQSFQGYGQQGQIQYGGNMMHLNGASYAYQIVPLSGQSRYHLLNCVAYKQSKSAQVSPGWAGIGITYYDATWAVIDSFEKQIALPFDSGPAPFRPCTLGLQVPADAAFAIIWASNDDAGTQTFVDDLKLYDYQKASYNIGLGPYLGSTSPVSFQDTTGQRVDLSGLQFWWTGGFEDFATGLIGNVGQPAWIAQEVDVTPNMICRVSLLDVALLSSTALTNFGLDYYDANWNRISGEYRTADPFGEVVFETTAPAGTAHTVAWIWVEALTSIDQQVGAFGMNVEQVDNVPPEITLDTTLANKTDQDTGLSVDLRYRDNLNSVAYNFSSQAVQLIGPNDEIYTLDFFGSNTLTNTEIVLNFKLVPVDFSWSTAPSGTYTVRLLDGAIMDSYANAAAGKVLGTFQKVGPN